MQVADLVNETLAERFKLEKMIGKGGWGAVFRAVQLSIERPCAVKVLKPDESARQNAVQRFHNEARTTSHLTHPNSVVIYEFGHDEEKDVLFLAMELLEGETLLKYMKDDGPLAPELVVHITRQAAASLQEAHDLGAVHRDIKPHNIMLVERGADEHFVKVIDFGIAKALGRSFMSVLDLTRTGMMIGTPRYMSPEQIRAHDVDGRTDQYSLAITVYQMLTGRTPFGSGTAMEVASRHLTERPLPLTAYNPDLDVPPSFEKVLLKAIEKEPEARFETISAFGEALAAALEERGGEGWERFEIPEFDESEDDEGSTRSVPREEWLAGEESVQMPGDALSAEESREENLPEEDDEDESRVTAVAKFEPEDEEDVEEVEETGDSVEMDGSEDGTPITGEFHQGAVVSSVVVVAGLLMVTGLALTGGDVASASSSEPTEEAATTPVTKEASASPNPPSSPSPSTREVDERPTKSTAAVKAEAAGAAEYLVEQVTRAAGRMEERPKPAPQGWAEVRMIPWGTLYVGNRKRGQGSRLRVQLPVGFHTLVMKQNGEVVVQKNVRVRGGRTSEIDLIAR